MIGEATDSALQFGERCPYWDLVRAETKCARAHVEVTLPIAGVGADADRAVAVMRACFQLHSIVRFSIERSEVRLKLLLPYAGFHYDDPRYWQLAEKLRADVAPQMPALVAWLDEYVRDAYARSRPSRPPPRLVVND